MHEAIAQGEPTVHVANASTSEQPSLRGADAPAAEGLRPKRVPMNLEPAAAGSLAHRLTGPAIAANRNSLHTPAICPGELRRRSGGAGAFAGNRMSSGPMAQRSGIGRSVL